MHQKSDTQTNRVEKAARRWNNKGLVKNHFFLKWMHPLLGSQVAIPSLANCGCTWLFQSYWDNHLFQLSRNVLQGKDAHSPLTTTTRVLYWHSLWKRSSSELLPLFCIYVASLMDYDVCHLLLFPHQCIFPQIIINFDLVNAFILFVSLTSVFMLFLAALIY